jgi:hypothetical protein
MQSITVKSEKCKTGGTTYHPICEMAKALAEVRRRPTLSQGNIDMLVRRKIGVNDLAKEKKKKK